jgi:hypothetical protein
MKTRLVDNTSITQAVERYLAARQRFHKYYPQPYYRCAVLDIGTMMIDKIIQKYNRHFWNLPTDIHYGD